MKQIAKYSGHLSIFAALSHIFCCGLPFIASILSLSSTLGGSLSVTTLHDTLHHYELELLVFSAVMLSLSGVSLWFARNMDCRADGHCHHEPCAPKKKLSHRFFIAACVIFMINLGYFLIHQDIVHIGHAH